MTDVILDILIDAALDTLKLLPYLFLTYLLMEFLENKMNDRAVSLVHRSGKLGPVLGSIMGIIPQCGFSAAMSNLYAGGLITRGTLIAVFLSTSDEMLPILISEKAPASLIFKILGVKLIAGILAGVLIDLLYHTRRLPRIHDLCEDENCECEDGIFLSSLKHTVKIGLFILAVNIVLTAVMVFVGTERLSAFILHKPVIGELISGLIGLIPNCAASVAITELYLQGAMRTGAMLSGLLVGSGVGLLVLFRMNRSLKDNLQTLFLLYFSGICFGFLAGLLPIF